MDIEIIILVGKNIRKFRKLRGLTQEALSEKIDVHPTTIGRIERGKFNVSLGNLDKISKVLKIKVKDLF